MNDDIKATIPPEESQLIKKEAAETDARIEELVREAPPEVREFLEKAPPEVRKTFMGVSTRTVMGSPFPHPIFDKFTPQHVDKFLDLNEEESKRSFKFACQGRWFALGSGIIALGFIIFLVIYLLPNNRELLVDILRILIIFAGGFGAGFGYKSLNRS